MPKPSHLERVMDGSARVHITRVPRPHLAQEYKDTNRDPKELDSICRGLLPHARMCAEGRARPHIVARVETRRDQLLKRQAKHDIRAAWDAVDAGLVA